MRGVGRHERRRPRREIEYLLAHSEPAPSRDHAVDLVFPMRLLLVLGPLFEPVEARAQRLTANELGVGNGPRARPDRARRPHRYSPSSVRSVRHARDDAAAAPAPAAFLSARMSPGPAFETWSTSSARALAACHPSRASARRARRGSSPSFTDPTLEARQSPGLRATTS